MTVKSEYIFIIVLGVLLIASIIFNGVLWEKGSDDLVKYKEKQAKENIRIQDSIVDSKEKIIKSLVFTQDSLVLEANNKNTKADKIKTIIIHDKQVMNEEISNVPLLSNDSNVALFQRLSGQYQP